MVNATRDCDLVVTTHPFGAQALGQARRAGKLQAPAVTYLTDTSVHALWIHPDVDLNLAIHEVAAQEAREWGGAASVVRPLVSPAAVDAATRRYADPLASLGIRGPRVLVTGGSLGVGELDRAARDIVDIGLTPVVLCGTDSRLRRRLERTPGVVALGWRDDLPALLATSDCIVQNAGGFTSLEALASGTPVVTYLPVPGHGVANSRNLERAGLIPWARTREELAIRPPRHEPAYDLGARPGWTGRQLTPALTATGRTRRALFRRLSGISHGPHIALSFDDGPDPARTPPGSPGPAPEPE